MKHTRLTIALLIAVHLLATGCTPTLNEPIQKVDKFFQDLGYSINQTTRKITGEQPPTEKQRNYDAQNKPVFTIQKFSVTPAKVNKGENVKLTLQYVIMGAPAEGLKVKEKNTLATDGKQLTVLKDESTLRENGTWESVLTFAVPESAKSGEYIVRQELSAHGLFRSSRRTFTVQ